MSYLPLDQMKFADSANMDAFQRLRVSDPMSLFAASQEYSSHPLLWDHHTTSGGAATHQTTTNSTILSTAGSTSGARALRQTHVYLRYIPGKSHLIKMTGTLRKGALPTGAAKARIGYYDDGNGLFFEDASDGVHVVVRSDTPGAGDTRYAQSAWNVDKMNGTGPSGITIDWAKEQIFIIDFQWLAVGRVRFGLQINGRLFYVHEQGHANRVSVVYMRTACLPPRYEVFNQGGAGSAVSVEAVCTAVESEGGTVEDDYYVFCYNAYLTPVTLDSTMRPYVTRRLRDTFNGLTVRGHAHLDSFDLLIGSNPVYWEIRYNPIVTIGAGGTLVGPTNVDTAYSISEFDTYTGSNNTMTGGVVVANGLAAPGSGSNRNALSIHQPGARPLLGRTYAGVRDSYTLCARSLGNSSTMTVSIQLREQY